MSLRTRISEWWAGQKDGNRVVQIQVVELAGTGFSKPVMVHRREAQLIAHVLSHGRNSLTIWIESCLVFGIGLGVLCSTLFVSSGGKQFLMMAIAGIFCFASYGALAWLGWGFRYQRGVP